MKVLYIDPWYANNSNLYYYSSGLADSIGQRCDLTVVCSKKCDIPDKAHYQTKKYFFGLSDKMKKNKIRKIVRGIEYVLAYKKILNLLGKEHYDIVHIEWLLFYKFDLKMLKKIKNKTRLLIFKAHNVIPHVNGEGYVPILNKIYAIPDIILLHGFNLINEFKNMFPIYSAKTRIQKFGINLNHNLDFDTNSISESIASKVKSFGRVFIFFGRIGYGKGVDRIINAWKENSQFDTSLLIIAGKTTSDVNEKELCDSVNGMNNIMLLNGYVEDNLLNYLIFNSNIVLMPYREGSMSAVAFTAAEFSKPILSTNFGSITEYVIDNECGFISENDDIAFVSKLKTIDLSYTNDELSAVGQKYNKYLNDNYGWDEIGEELVNDVYKQELISKGND